MNQVTLLISFLKIFLLIFHYNTFISITELYLEPSDNVYRGTGDLAYLNGQIRIAFIRGNEILEKSDGIPLDGKILTGICVIANGDTVREAARKSVSKYSLIYI